MPIDPSVSHFKNLGKRSYIHGKRNRHAKKTGSSFIYKDTAAWKEDPYLMARCGYRLANLYIRMNEPQKAQWAASFIPPIRGMEGARALIRKWTTPASNKKKA